MSKVEYECIVYDRDSDIAYGAEFDNREDAQAQVDEYRQLLADNGEEDLYSYIEVGKQLIDDDGEPIDNTYKVIKTYSTRKGW